MGPCRSVGAMIQLAGAFLLIHWRESRGDLVLRTPDLGNNAVAWPPAHPLPTFLPRRSEQILGYGAAEG